MRRRSFVSRWIPIVAMVSFIHSFRDPRRPAHGLRVRRIPPREVDRSVTGRTVRERSPSFHPTDGGRRSVRCVASDPRGGGRSVGRAFRSFGRCGFSPVRRSPPRDSRRTERPGSIRHIGSSEQPPLSSLCFSSTPLRSLDSARCVSRCAAAAATCCRASSP